MSARLSEAGAVWVWLEINLEAPRNGAGGQSPMVSSHFSTVYWDWSTSNLEACSCGPVTSQELARGVIPYVQPPLLVQYDPQFGDAFWNSSKYGMVTYLLRMMTSWAIVCSVWYLPPMTREVGVPRPAVCCVCVLWGPGVCQSPHSSSITER